MNSILLDTNAYTGFYGGSKPDWNSNILNDFLKNETVKIIEVTHRTAKIFGSIKNELRLNAKMIPVNDIWSAAHAIETDSTLISYDKHFTNISNLKIWLQISQ